MKYKPCCNLRCMVLGCKENEQGACYCICRLCDRIHALGNIIDGHSLYDGVGTQYIPDPVYREQIYNSWPEEKKQWLKNFKENEAPKLLVELKEMLKSYEI